MIESIFLTRDTIKDYLSNCIESNFNIEGNVFFDKQVAPILNSLSEEIIFLYEYPYVEKYYRDSYYNFYSKKHSKYNRDSIRISFFSKKINANSFFDTNQKDHLQQNFYGYITIRPTTYKIIGHSLISPQALKTNNFVSCLSEEEVLISGCKLKVEGFPYISQDNESITCSESTIINLLDYFSHKYPEYSILLPSHVSKILSKHSSERQLPSKGMPSDNISFVLKKIGFGTVVYSNDSKSKNIFPDKTFKELMYAYIESGIPIIATLSSKKNNHAVIVIGRKSITEDIEIKNGLISRRSYIPFSDTFQRLLIMDDNQPPYKLVDFNKPIYDNESKSYYEIKSIIVPLYSKIHLEAYQFKSVFSDILKILNKNLKINNNTINLIPTKGKYVLRYFITSSRSYKEYISSSPNISFEYKSLIVDKAMPKFIWVGEILEGNTIKIKQTVYSILILDATESGKTGQLILASNQKHLIFDNLSGVETPKNQYLAIKFDDNQILLTFANNLKSKII